MKNSAKCCLILLCILSGSVWAGAYCYDEKLTSVIVNSGGIYFTTDKSCPNWCEINSSWSAEVINRSYSMLLSAQAQNRVVRFYWEEHATTCAGAVPVYANPTSLSIL